MARNWTPSQSVAMSTLGRTLLISAAAGSGKTATLTERIIRRLTDPTDPAELSRMLIVTFTRAAAAELKERISAALSDAIARDPGNRHLQRQLIGLGGAHISTIDAFCREPVKENFAALGLPASSRIADEAELSPLRERVMGELIDEFYIRYAKQNQPSDSFSLLWDNPFADLCDSLTSSKNDNELIPTLLSLYDRLLSFPEELERLKQEADELDLAVESETFEFFSTRHGKILAEWVKEFATHGITLLERALQDFATDPSAFKAYGCAFQNDLNFCTRLADTESYADAYALLTSYRNERLGALRGADPIFVAYKEQRTELVDGIKGLRDDYFRDPPEAVAEQMEHTAMLCRVLYSFLSEYDRRIMSEKKIRGICDFTDNRRYLLSLLRDKNGLPSGMATELRNRFDEVYIDEYQDVDEMQDEIFRLVGGDHRFMVGDIKQSIYGFRGADPSVFARYRRNLPQLDPHSDPSGSVVSQGNSIFMSDNFRCDESVIRVTNAVCGQIFRACPDAIGYLDEDDLGFSKPKPFEGYVTPAVTVSVLVEPPRTRRDGMDIAGAMDEASGVEAEAMYVANEIAGLLRNKVPLANSQPIKPSDIVILMRNRTSLSVYMKALTAMGIPTGSEELEAAQAGRDLLHGTDMSYLVNLLRVLDDPNGDIPLSEVLRAPFPGLDLEELIAIRNVGDAGVESHSLYGGIEEYVVSEDADPVLRDKLTAFLAWMEYYRRLIATQPANKLLRLLRRDSRCACRATPAFRYLYECARTYRSSVFVSLGSFLRYFENRLRTTKNVPAPSEGRDGHVSIMTIHRSKGLEFPVCFVVRCGQSFSARSYTSDMIFEKRAGVSLKLYRRNRSGDHTEQYKTDTALRRASALAVKLSEREEEMRVLYVAMTRARERLYLIGTGNGKSVSFSEGDRFATLSCSSYLKWILAGLDAHPEISRFVELNRYPVEEIASDAPLHMIHNTVLAENPVASRYASVLQDIMPPSPMERALGMVPTKIPASRMRELLLDECVFYDTDLDPKDGKLPTLTSQESWCDAQSLAAIRQSLELMRSSADNEFELLLSEKRRPTASEKGTAAHLFLQFCDYNRVLCSGIEEEIALLRQLGYINDRTAQILDASLPSAFFQSKFFKRVCEADTVRREYRFTRFLPLAKLTSDPQFAEALGDRVLQIQGSIDLLCIFADGHIELCDYKTDHISEAERRDPSLLKARMREKHGEQMSQYVAAVEEAFGVRPTHTFIYSIPLGEAIEIEA